MDWYIIAAFTLPELFLLVLGLVAILISLLGGGDFLRLFPMYKPRGREVDPSYWGKYISENQNACTTSGIRLPKLVQERVDAHSWDRDWTGQKVEAQPGGFML